MIFSFLQISRAFHEIQWFFHDLETDLNFNDFSRAVGTLGLWPDPEHTLHTEYLLLVRELLVVCHEYFKSDFLLWEHIVFLWAYVIKSILQETSRFQSVRCMCT